MTNTRKTVAVNPGNDEPRTSHESEVREIPTKEEMSQVFFGYC